MTTLLAVALACSSLTLSTQRSPSTAVVAVPAAAGGEAEARAATLGRLVHLGREENQATEHLRYLSEEISHRLTSSSSLERAEQWAVERFQEFGLEARLEKWGEYEVGFDRIGERGGMVRPVVQSYVFRTSAWSPGTPGPLRGRAVLEPKTMDELEALEDLRGAWFVKRLRSDRPEREVRRALPDVIQAASILGTVGDGGEPMQVFGNSNVEWDDLPRDVAVRVRRDQYEDLVARLVAGEHVELEFDIDNRFRKGPIDQHNVIAEIPGGDLAHEVVIVGGHLDSWHCADGTQDNGTGVASTLEAARLLAAAGAQPRRTIRFMLWSGEEQGLLGSKGYVDEHKDELIESVSAVLVHDGGTNYVSGIAGPAPMIAGLREAFAPALDLHDEMKFEVIENDGLSGGGSDHSSFRRIGIPGFFWEQSGRTEYGYAWHTQYDTFENAVPEYLDHSALVIAVGALGLADLDEKLDRRAMRKPPSRRMGVFLEDTVVTGVSRGGLAKKAGWEEGDRVISIDGVAVATRAEIVDAIQVGGPVKNFTLERGEEQVESVLDWSDDENEEKRRAHAAELEEARSSLGAQGDRGAAEPGSEEQQAPGAVEEKSSQP